MCAQRRVRNWQILAFCGRKITFNLFFSVSQGNEITKIYDSQREKMYLKAYAPIEDSDQTAHPRSLIRVFARRFVTPYIKI